MTTSSVDPETVRAELRKVAEAALYARLAHIDTITDARTARVAAAAKVAEARAEESAAAAAEEAAFRAAVHGGGWTTTELRKAGLVVPDSVARPGARRPTRAVSSAKRTTSAKQAPPTKTAAAADAAPADTGGSTDTVQTAGDGSGRGEGAA